MAVTALVVGACGSTSSNSTATTAPAATTPSTAASTTATAAALDGSLTVYAAASLTESFNDIKSSLAPADPGLSLTYSFAGSQALVQQIQQGAPADVFASADKANMAKLSSAGLVDTPQTFARNKLEIAVAPGNPTGITGLADLAKPGLKVTLEDASVPAGNYARKALMSAGVSVTPVSSPLDVKSALLTVTSGEADATVVYVTDVVASGGKAAGVAIPDANNVIATYPVAVVKASSHAASARAYVAYLLSAAGQKALAARGFLAP